MGVPFRTTGWRAKDTFHSRSPVTSPQMHMGIFIHLIRSYVTFYCAHVVHSRYYDITSMDDVVYILCSIRTVVFIRDTPSILIGFVGDPPSVILCKHDCRIVKSTHQQHVEHSKKHTILNA